MTADGRRVRRVVTDRRGGAGSAPYDTFNLATHVGDDPHHVAINRARLARSLAVEPAHLVWMEQIHGTTVRRVDGPQTAPLAGCDAVVTATRGMVLAVAVADCVPVLLADAETGVVAAVHAGRRGVRLGIVARAVAVMVEAGARPDRIDALLGPAVCGQCYEVPAAMRADVAAHAPGSATRTRAGTPGLDLAAGIAGQLARVGVTRVATDPRCTMEDPTLFSHRRDGVTGRQVGVVWST